MLSTLRQSGLLARNASRGFSLVEMAVVLTIVAVLLGALLVPLATQHQLRTNKEAERELREIREAIIGFTVANGRLPWPDTDAFTPDGVENVPAGVLAGPPTAIATTPCTLCEGLLPWQTLGIVPADPWGRVYRYRISPEFGYFVQTGQPAGTEQFDLMDPGVVRVNTRGDDPASGGGGERKEPIVLTTDAAAAVVSHGNNGAGARNFGGSVMTPAPAGTDERVNSDGTNTTAPAPHFYARQITVGESGCDDTVEGVAFCEYDDLVIWIPRVVLINRMVEAGRLP